MKKLILASTSPYRRELLERLGVPFTASKPMIDEDTEKDPNLSPLDLAQKLAYLKAQSLAAPGRVVIGGDQIAVFEGEILGKPHTEENAFLQIKKLQGQTHDLVTAVCIFDELMPHSFVNFTQLKMKSLSDEQIIKYVKKDLPLDCAGAYKIEKAGISLFEKIETTDFTAIQGLPLMELNQALEEIGFTIP